MDAVRHRAIVPGRTVAVLDDTVVRRTGPISAREHDALHCGRLGAPEPARPPERIPPPPGRAARSLPHPMFDTLSDRLRKTLANLTGRGRISEADVDAAMREVRLSLLEADVNFKVVKDFVARVRERADRGRHPREPDRRPAGRRRSSTRSSSRSCRRATGRSTSRATRRSCSWRAPGLGQDDDRGQARPPRRQARPPAAARRRRPVPADRRRPARDARPRRSTSRSTGRRPGRRSSTSPGAASRPPAARSATSSSSTRPAG